MFKKLVLATAALSMGVGAIVPVTAASAQRYDRYERRDSRDGYYNRGYRDRGYRNYRAREKCKDGDGGTIVGAIAGGLLGRGVAGRGDHVLGTVLGAGAGALAGRAIDRSDRPGYCR
ncbi:glycine zipper 2TM domain-containing protein [Sphingomonas aracearum]|uniref:17 kDa surface antigen n=1 Tax=Sphingomonas aracearum TaxID=2283317 RepID=A0A369VY85_9SPHN|nr:glycine zipper 2TM domain-containing protein [Sphingomonas aracearum]RDE06022.1 glycine zipper 2TM domain-containing protein [Sphingomonas aracearum]